MDFALSVLALRNIGWCWKIGGGFHYWLWPLNNCQTYLVTNFDFQHITTFSYSIFCFVCINAYTQADVPVTVWSMLLLSTLQEIGGPFISY